MDVDPEVGLVLTRVITEGETGDDPGGNIYETDFLTEVGWPPEMDP